LVPWPAPLFLPPFGAVEPEHYGPAFDRALAAHVEEIGSIAADPAAPSFANTIETMERGGQALKRVSAVFFNLAGSHTNDALQAIEREMSPRPLAAPQRDLHERGALPARR
jgi:peptidyl-dipeptidase Dcp